MSKCFFMSVPMTMAMFVVRNPGKCSERRNDICKISACQRHASDIDVDEEGQVKQDLIAFAYKEAAHMYQPSYIQK